LPLLFKPIHLLILILYSSKPSEKKISMFLGLSSASQAVWLKTVILLGIAVLAFSSRLFSVIRFESVIHEFDPWFNYRTTKYLVNTNYYDFLNWFDERSW